MWRQLRATEQEKLLASAIARNADRRALRRRQNETELTNRTHLVFKCPG